MSQNTIAVLPFVNMSSDAENEFFSDGITEEIINALARIPGLKVISRTSSFFFKGKEIPLREIASQLGVSTILEGSVRFAGNQMRITAQLIEAAEDFHFWSETWDRKTENIFEIQDEISLLIADKLREHFGHMEIQDHLVEKQTENLSVYEYSLKARYHFNHWNPEEVGKAIELYEQALSLDPLHVESHIGLADAYGFMATTAFLPREEAWGKAKAAMDRALELAPEHPGVHYQLANYSFFVDFDFGEAAKHTIRSIELKPSYPEARQFLTFLHLLRGDFDQARHQMKLALDLNPLSPETQFYKAYYHYRTGEYAQGIEVINSLLAQNPMNLPAFITQAYCLIKMEKYGEVLDSLEKIPKEIIIPDEIQGIECLTNFLMGNTAKGQQLISQIQARAKDPHAFQAHSYLYLGYVVSGKSEAALDWMEQAIKLRSTVLLLTFSGPLADPVKQNPRYQEIFNRIYSPIPSLSAPSSGKSGLLDEKTARDHEQKLLSFIEAESPFLNPALSLRSLAEQIEIHPNQLSWLLNEKIGKNFNEFINHYRVGHFKKLALDPSNSHISLIGLAYESGFNSKTAFNTFFKKETGTTPSKFVKANS